MGWHYLKVCYLRQWKSVCFITSNLCAHHSYCLSIAFQKIPVNRYNLKLSRNNRACFENQIYTGINGHKSRSIDHYEQFDSINELRCDDRVDPTRTLI